MLKKITFISFVFYLFFSCGEKSIYRINVNLSNLQAQEIYVVFESEDFRTIDTLIYKGEGGFIISKEQADLRTLTIYYDNFTRWIKIYCEQPQRIVVSGDALYPQTIQVKGGKINDMLSEFRKETAILHKELAILSDNGESISEKQNGTINIAQLANISNNLHLQAEAFIKNNPDEAASAILISEYFIDPDNIDQINILLDGLNPNLADFYVVQEIRTYTEKAKQTIVGARAPNFNIKNIYGNTFSVDSFLNSYFVLAFTSMWDDECHTKELHLDEIITTFPKDSLSMLLISLDENPQKIRDLLRNDPVQWNIVTDSAGQAIELLDLYNVNVLPRCILMGKDGTIILKTDNGIELKKTLEILMQND